MNARVMIRLSVVALLAFWALAYYEMGLFGITVLLAFYLGLALLGAVISGVLGYVMRTEDNGD